MDHAAAVPHRYCAVERYSRANGYLLYFCRVREPISFPVFFPQCYILAILASFIAAGWWGAVLMTLGMFLPAFLFPIIGHDLFQALLRNPTVGLLLDGVMAAVLGAVAIICISIIFVIHITIVLDSDCLSLL